MIEKLANGIVDMLRKAWEFLNQDIPEWLIELSTAIGKIIFSLLNMAGQAYIEQIKAKIIEIDKLYPNATGEEKFNLVWDFAYTLLPAWKESKLDSLIQNLFADLKEVGLV